MSTEKTIGEIMQCEFAVAKKWFCFGILGQWLLVIVVAVAIVFNKGGNIFVICITFLGPLLVLFFREVGNHYYQKGEKIRHFYLLQQGLGIEPSETEMLNLYARATSAKTDEPNPMGNYYSSHYADGFPKLLHHLQESAFWTESQARLTMFVHYTLGVIGSLVAILLAIVWLYKGGGYANADHAKLFATLLLFFVAQTELPIARSFHSLSKTAGEVVSKTSSLRKQPNIDFIDILKIISTYNSALAKAMPLPGYSYRRLQKKLNTAWEVVQKK